MFLSFLMDLTVMIDTAAARPQIALFAAAPADMQPLACVGAIDWLICRPGAAGCTEFWRGDVRLATLEADDPVWTLTDLVAIFGLSDEAGLRGLAESFRRWLPSAGVAIEWIGAADPVAVLGRALDHCAAAMLDQRRHRGRMALDLAAYRGAFDTMQHKFSRLEAYVAEAGLGGLREVFSVPRAGGVIRLMPDTPAGGAAGEAAAVRWVLPVDSLGVAALWIFVAEAPPPNGPPLQVRLAAIETGQGCGTWKLQPGGTRAGWIQLVLGRALDEAALTLLLTLACSEPQDAQGCWVIGLAPPNPYPDMYASYALAPPGEDEALETHLPDGRLGAPLAVRVETGLPGTTPPVTLASVREFGSRLPAVCRLTDAEYANMREVQPDGDGAADRLVHYDQTFGFIQVHPRGGGAVTAACVAMTAPAGTWRLTASIFLAHAEANPAEFAILARLPGAADPDPAAFAACDGDTPCFSGWCTLPALERRSLSVILPDHRGKGLEIYLLTRQAAAPNFAWARFSDLHLHFLPGDGRQRAP